MTSKEFKIGIDLIYSERRDRQERDILLAFLEELGREVNANFSVENFRDYARKIQEQYEN